MKSPQQVFADYLEKNRLKMTPQRRLILDVFFDLDGHFSAEEIYDVVKKADSSVGQATVYRTLKHFLDAGLGRSVHFGDGVSRYEPSYGQEHHDHLICENCGKSVEVVDPEIERLQEVVAKDQGFILTRHKMYLYGLCPECRKSKK